MKINHVFEKIHPNALMGWMIVTLLFSQFPLFGCTGFTIKEDRRIPQGKRPVIPPQAVLVE